MNRDLVSRVWALVCVLVGPAWARADAPQARANAERAPETERPPTLGLRLDSFVALAGAFDDGLAPGFGVAAFVLYGPFEAGASALGETRLLGYNRVSAAGHLGLRARLDRVDLDAAGTAGVASVRSGGAWLSDDPGGTGSISFVGLRGGVSYAVFVARAGGQRISLGVTGSFEHDLDPYTVSYTYTERAWLFGASDSVQSGSARIGTDRALLLVGASFRFE